MKKEWIHHGMKGADVQGIDNTEKDKVQNIMREMFGISVLSGETIFIDKKSGQVFSVQPKAESKNEIFKKYHVQNPDLICYDHDGKVLIVEIDGPIHWQSRKGVRGTTRRSTNYEQAGIQVVTLLRNEVRKKNTFDLIANIGKQLGVKDATV